MKKIIFLWFLILSSCNNKPLINYSSDNFELIELSEGVFALIHKIGGKSVCNAGIIDTGSETIIFDTFLSPEAAEEIVRVVDTLNLSPIKYVINSHWHNDHIRGNQVFTDDVKIISTSKTAETIAIREPMELESEKEYASEEFKHYDSLYSNFKGDKNSKEFKEIMMWRPYYEVLSESSNNIKTRLPNMMVDDTLEINGSKRKVVLLTKGAGHTSSDLILYLPKEGVVFTGDLIFNQSHPYLGNGDIDGLKYWYSYMDKMNIYTIVPGHGDIGDKELISTMSDYLDDVKHLGDSILQNNSLITETYNTKIPVKYEDWWFHQFFGSNVNFGYITQCQRDLVTIIEKLKADTNHKYLKTFRPTLEDCKAIFKTDEMAEKVFMYSESKWLTIGELPDDSMKPLDASAKLKINKASGMQLFYNLTYGLPEDYIDLGQHLRPYIVVYGFQYLNEDGSLQKERTAFFRIQDKWVFIPRPFMSLNIYDE